MRITFITDSLEPPTYDKVYRKHHVGRIGLVLDEAGTVTGFTLTAYCGMSQHSLVMPVGDSVEPTGTIDCATCMETKQ